jgi:hypothetical protein
MIVSIVGSLEYPRAIKNPIIFDTTKSIHQGTKKYLVLVPLELSSPPDTVQISASALNGFHSASIGIKKYTITHLGLNFNPVAPRAGKFLYALTPYPYEYSLIFKEIPSEDAKQIDKQMELYYDAHPPSFVPNKTDYNIGDLDMNGLKWYFERY